ncbi:hypothetical protein DV735_g5025, partial [Chaetothyriales sp. CBS 134920]
MASTPAPASAIRPSLRDHRQHAGSPHTPTRFVPSTFSSPGSTLRQEEDAVILELDPRHLKAGFEGESGPQCVIPFGPDGARRVGDYRPWLPDYRTRSAKFTTEAAQRELWRNDLSDFDLGLMEDRLERAVREAYHKHLLTDAGTARLVLVLPSLVPLPVLSSMLTVLFERWKFPSITLLPSPTTCTVAAGLRSALVVDIGWEETVVTPVYECRELASRRSIRGMKRLVGAMKEKLQAVAGQQHTVVDHAHPLRQDFDFVEDFVHRLAFCKDGLQRRTEGLTIDPDARSSASDRFAFDWPCHGSTESITLDRDAISDVVEGVFFGVVNGSDSDALYDDQEEPLDRLVYQTLLGLPPDTRGTCMSRITFTGHGHRIPGVDKRIMHDLDALLRKFGWNAVRGAKLKPSRKGLAEVAQARAAPADYKHNIDRALDDRDLVTPKLSMQKAKYSQPGPQGVLRAVNTLGPWAGASLLTSLKVRGIVDIDRDKFLSHGLAGASKDHDPSVVPQQRPGNLGVGPSSKSTPSSDILRFFRLSSLSSSTSGARREKKETGGAAPVIANDNDNDSESNVTSDVDPLPSSRPGLEGRINYHISRLDRLKVRLADLNVAIEQETAEYRVSAASLQRQGMGAAVLDLARQLACLRSARDGLRPSVAFHRRELARIARKRLRMDRRDRDRGRDHQAGGGEQPRLPGVYASLDGDDVWEARFAP